MTSSTTLVAVALGLSTTPVGIGMPTRRSGGDCPFNSSCAHLAGLILCPHDQCGPRQRYRHHGADQDLQDGAPIGRGVASGRPAHTEGCLPRAAGTVGMWQIDGAAHSGGLGAAHQRNRTDQRGVTQRTAQTSRTRHRLSGFGVAAVAQRRLQHQAAVAGGGHPRRTRPDRRPGQAGRARGIREGQTRATLRRDATAGVDRPRVGRQADGTAARRAVRRPRRHDKATTQRRTPAYLDREARDDADGHPRHRRSRVPFGRRRRHEPEARPGDRNGADRPPPSAHPRHHAHARVSPDPRLSDRVVVRPVRRHTGNRVTGRPPWFGGFVGIVGLLLVWWLLAALGAAGGTIPTPVDVISTMARDGTALYWSNFAVTSSGALQGFLWGNGLAIALAVLVVLVPPVESLATQLAILSYCTPLLALGPIILVVFGGRAPTIFLAAMYCFFTTMVGTLAGLRSADKASLDLVEAYGGGKWQKFTKVRLFAAAPHTLAELKIAATSAVVGAIP